MTLIVVLVVVMSGLTSCNSYIDVYLCVCMSSASVRTSHQTVRCLQLYIASVATGDSGKDYDASMFTFC